MDGNDDEHLSQATAQSLFFKIANPERVSRDKQPVATKPQVTFNAGTPTEVAMPYMTPQAAQGDDMFDTVAQPAFQTAMYEDDDNDDDFGDNDVSDSGGDEMYDGFAAAPSAMPSAAPSSGDDDDLHAKQELLMTLQKLKLQGINPTREYTLNDNLADIRWEVQSHIMNRDTLQTVAMLKTVLRMVFFGIEIANRKLGGVLQLDGYARYQTQPDMLKRFESPLERLYRKYFGYRGTSPPEVELLMGIGVGILTYHFQGVISGRVAGGGNAPETGRKRAQSGIKIQELIDDSDDESDDDDDAASETTSGNGSSGGGFAGMGMLQGLLQNMM